MNLDFLFFKEKNSISNMQDMMKPMIIIPETSLKQVLLVCHWYCIPENFLSDNFPTLSGNKKIAKELQL